MHNSSKAPAECRHTIFNLAGIDIPFLEDGSTPVFLFKPVGAFLSGTLLRWITLAEGNYNPYFETPAFAADRLF